MELITLRKIKTHLRKDNVRWKKNERRRKKGSVEMTANPPTPMSILKLPMFPHPIHRHHLKLQQNSVVRSCLSELLDHRAIDCFQSIVVSQSTECSSST